MKNYTLVKNFGKSNTPDRLFYVMDYTDLINLKNKQLVLFGDKAYVLRKGKMAYYGKDEIWYDENGDQI